MLQSSTPARQVAALALVAALLVFTCNTAIEMRRAAIRNMSQRAYNSRPLADRVHPLPRIAHVMSTTGTEELRVMRLFNNDWDFRVYDLAGADAYMRKHCPQYYRTFTTVVPIAYKSDVFRLCALWSEAGLYIDDDMLPLHPLSEIAIANSDGLLLVDDRPHTNWWGRTIYNGTYNGYRRNPAPRPIFQLRAVAHSSSGDESRHTNSRQHLPSHHRPASPDSVRRAARVSI